MSNSKLTPVSIRIEEDVIENLKRMARFEAFEQDRDITYVDLIREAIVNTYPMPTNENL
jgi:hypothetical protein